eukprot:Tbor_TRINITY_DN5882_c0_g1::TRINITY_DN5882_c0_g1_i1::g.7266::m.7266
MYEEEIIKIESINIRPQGVCPLHSPLTIEMKYSVNMHSDISNTTTKKGWWELVFQADYTQRQVCVPLYKGDAVVPLTTHSEDCPYIETLIISLDDIPTGKIKEKHLLQVGLLKLTLRVDRIDGGIDNLASINMVTQVSKDADCVLVRNILSPIE